MTLILDHVIIIFTSNTFLPFSAKLFFCNFPVPSIQPTGKYYVLAITRSVQEENLHVACVGGMCFHSKDKATLSQILSYEVLKRIEWMNWKVIGTGDDVSDGIQKPGKWICVWWSVGKLKLTSNNLKSVVFFLCASPDSSWLVNVFCAHAKGLPIYVQEALLAHCWCSPILTCALTHAFT